MIAKKIILLMMKKKVKNIFYLFTENIKYKMLLKKDQVLLIQIVKEERGTKGGSRLQLLYPYQEGTVYLLPNNSSTGGSF